MSDRPNPPADNAGAGERPQEQPPAVTPAVGEPGSPTGADALRDPPPAADNPEQLLGAANDASGAARNAWLAFMGLLAYLLITLAGVTHIDLLRNSPVGLPIVNVDIPLFSFFLAAPVLLLLVHLSLLIQHALLARKYQLFSEAIAARESDDALDPMRRLVHNYVFSQMLAGPKPPWPLRMLMRLMIFVTFSLLPVVTLLYFQVKILPTHDVAIVHLIRIAILIDLLLLLVVRPYVAMPYLTKRSRKLRLGKGRWRWEMGVASFSVAAVLGIAVMAFSLLVATVPQACFWPIGERTEEEEKACFSLDRMMAETRWSVPVGREPDQRKVFLLTEWLFEGDLDVKRKSVDSLFSRNLIVIDEDLVPEKEFSDGEISLDLRGRDLRFAFFDGSDLQRADLFGSDLRGVSAQSATLNHAKLEHAKMQGAYLQKVNLHGAILASANMEGADLASALMQKANLRSAQMRRVALTNALMQEAELYNTELRDADLRGAQLREADLRSAQLQAADLTGSQMLGTDLAGAQMQGADLRSARMAGAILWGAKMHGADLRFAQLPGANLEGAEMQAADLRFAEMLGAGLGGAYLHGADLRSAQLLGADLGETRMQGTNLSGTQMQGADLSKAEIWLIAPAPAAFSDAVLFELSFVPPDDARLDAILKSIEDEESRENAKQRLVSLLDPAKVQAWTDSADLKMWEKMSNRPQPNSDAVAENLARLACSDETGGFLIRGVAQRIANKQEHKVHEKLTAAKLVGDESCAAAEHLDEETAEKLQQIAESPGAASQGSVEDPTAAEPDLQ